MRVQWREKRVWAGLAFGVILLGVTVGSLMLRQGVSTLETGSEAIVYRDPASPPRSQADDVSRVVLFGKDDAAMPVFLTVGTRVRIVGDPGINEPGKLTRFVAVRVSEGPAVDKTGTVDRKNLRPLSH